MLPQISAPQPLLRGPKVLPKKLNLGLKVGLLFKIWEFLFNFLSRCSPNFKKLGNTNLTINFVLITYSRELFANREYFIIRAIKCFGHYNKAFLSLFEREVHQVLYFQTGLDYHNKDGISTFFVDIFPLCITLAGNYEQNIKNLLNQGWDLPSLKLYNLSLMLFCRLFYYY